MTTKKVTKKVTGTKATVTKATETNGAAAAIAAATTAPVTAAQMAATVTAPAAVVTEAKPADTVVAQAAPVTTASPLADRVAQAIAYIKMAIAILGLTAPALSALDRKRTAKLRKGGDKFIPQIAQIAQTWAVQIRTQPTSAMTSAIETATVLQPLVTLLAGFLQEAQDTSLQAEGTSWSTASALYSVMKRMSRKDPTLKAQLTPIAEFFKYRNPVVKANAAAVKVPKVSRTSQRKARVLANAQRIVAGAGAAATSGAVASAPVVTSAGPTGPAAH